MADLVRKTTAPRKTTAKKKVIFTPESPAASSHHDIELLAYQLWEDHGRQQGHDAHHWLRAEQQLKT